MSMSIPAILLDLRADAQAATVSNRPLSLATWHSQHDTGMELDVFMIWARQQLELRSFMTKLVKDPPRPGERFSHSFSDVLVF